MEITLEEIAQRLNDLLIEAVRKNRFSHPIFQIGTSRLEKDAAVQEDEASEGEVKMGGIFWEDFDDFEQSLNANDIKQVVGHTPPRKNGMGIRGTNSLNIINLDAGLCKVYGGNHAYLAFELDGAMKAFLMIEQGWVETPIALSGWENLMISGINNLNGYAC